MTDGQAGTSFPLIPFVHFVPLRGFDFQKTEDGACPTDLPDFQPQMNADEHRSDKCEERSDAAIH